MQGLICSGIAYYLQSVVNKARGPVFVTAFSPLSMIITAILGAIILAEQLHLGRYFIYLFDYIQYYLLKKIMLFFSFLSYILLMMWFIN